MTTTSLWGQDKPESEQPVQLQYDFEQAQGMLYLKDPVGLNIKTYNYQVNSYSEEARVNDNLVRIPRVENLSAYSDRMLHNSSSTYFEKRLREIRYFKDNPRPGEVSSLLPQFTVNLALFETLFGSRDFRYDIGGNMALDLSVNYQHVEHPELVESTRGTLSYLLEPTMQFNASAQLGERVKFALNYDTENNFSFDNQTNLAIDFTQGAKALKGQLPSTPQIRGDGNIIQRVEVGNVGLRLTNDLVTAADAITGVRFDFRLGDTRFSTVVGEQQSTTNSIKSAGTSNVIERSIALGEYDQFQHYFLANYFYDTYDKVLEKRPLINTSMNITRIEVWVLEKVVINTTNESRVTRSLLSFFPLGDGDANPDNKKNPELDPEQLQRLHPAVLDRSTARLSVANMGYREGTEFVMVENARRLDPEEYRLNEKLGYISLRRRLSDNEVLSVAYEYTFNGQKYKVGEFSDDAKGNNNKPLITKLLKTNVNMVGTPYWRLMMKNIYRVNALIKPENFSLELTYFDQDRALDLNYWKDENLGKTLGNRHLLRVFGLDNLSRNQSYNPDGLYDFLEGITVEPQDGLIIFPTVEPIGKTLAEQFDQADITDTEIRDDYVFSMLYDSTYAIASRYLPLDRYKLKLKFESDNSIRSTPGIVPGSKVIVKVGGKVLKAGTDYYIDYVTGKVEIINEEIKRSNQEVEIVTENLNFFQNNTRTFYGLNVEHTFSPNFKVSGTYIRLVENVNFSRNRIGMDPVDNSMYGLNMMYKSDVSFLNKPLSYFTTADVKTPSTLNFKWNYAAITPDQSDTRQNNTTSSYIDDFESIIRMTTLQDIRLWTLGSVPQYMPSIPQAYGNTMGIKSGFGRGRLSFYRIDGSFYSIGQYPSLNLNSILSDPYTAPLYYRDLYPLNDQPSNFGLQTIPVMDIQFDPTERGPYNLDFTKLDTQGKINNPKETWASMVMPLDRPNFEENNTAYIQFWIMDPHQISEISPSTQGALYIHLGQISEDVLRDGLKSYENGLPANDLDTDTLQAEWGIVPNRQSIRYVFDNDNTTRSKQDIGLDGLNNEQEKTYPSYVDYIQKGNAQFVNTLADISADDYRHFSSTDWAPATPVHDRYAYINNFEGNSPVDLTDDQNPANKLYPDAEDMNYDQNMNINEAYYEYKVPFIKNINFPNSLEQVQKGSYVTDIKVVKNNSFEVKWYQLTIPLRNPSRVLGTGVSFRNIPSVRMVLQGFDKKIQLRIAELRLISSDWIASEAAFYGKDFDTESEIIVDRVNFDRDGARDAASSYRYSIPPGVKQDKVVQNNETILQNEQALSLKVCDLNAAKRAAVQKEVNLNLLNYNELDMYVHLHQDLTQTQEQAPTFFFRLGNDLQNQYYEVRYPLTATQLGAVSPTDIWPVKNNLRLRLEELIQLKIKRNKASSDVSKEYTTTNQRGQTLIVKGNPTFSEIKFFQLGLVNEGKQTLECQSVWVNELRTVGFKNRDGWATNADLNVKLSKLATVDASFNHASVGFGNVAQSVQERRLDAETAYSLRIGTDFDRFLPELGIHVPTSFYYQNRRLTPAFNPLLPDVTFDESLESLTPEERANVEAFYIERNSNRVFNVTGAKIDHPQWMWNLGPLNLDNLTASYSSTQSTRTNIVYEIDTRQTSAASINYVYNPQSMSFYPLRSWITWKPLRLLSQFNFNLLPQNLSGGIEYKRQFDELRFRKSDANSIALPSSFNKNTSINWQYSILHSLASNLQLRFNANAAHIVDELNEYDQDGNRRNAAEIEAVFNENLRSFGRPINYHHVLNLTYGVPIDLLPFMQWMFADVTYQLDYDWQAPQPELFDELGNTLQSKSTLAANALVNMPVFYALFGVSPRPIKLTKLTFGKFFKGLFTGIKNLSVNYNKAFGNVLPGYKPSVGIIGQQNFNSSFAPGLDYLSGITNFDGDIAHRAFDNGWLVQNVNQSFIYTYTQEETLGYNMMYQPFTNLALSLRGQRTETQSRSFQLDQATDQFTKLFPQTTGTLTFSTIGIGSVFEDIMIKDTKAYLSIKDKSQKLLQDGVDAPIRNEDYILAFLESYTNQRAGSVFSAIPLPNWGLNLSVPMKNDFIQQITLTNNYQSTFNVGNYITNVSGEGELADKRFETVSLTDAFSPLVGLTLNMFNAFTVNSNYNYTKNTTFSISNLSITEALRNEFQLSTQYQFTDVKWLNNLLGIDPKRKDKASAQPAQPIAKGKKSKKDKPHSAGYTVGLSMSYIKDLNTTRVIPEDNFQVLSGQGVWNLRVDITFQLTKNMTAQAYYDHNITSPLVSSIFPTSNIRSGFNIRYEF